MQWGTARAVITTSLSFREPFDYASIPAHFCHFVHRATHGIVAAITTALRSMGPTPARRTTTRCSLTSITQATSASRRTEVRVCFACTCTVRMHIVLFVLIDWPVAPDFYSMRGWTSCVHGGPHGERAVASFLAAVLTEIYLCASCSCQPIYKFVLVIKYLFRKIEGRDGPGQASAPPLAGTCSRRGTTHCTRPRQSGASKRAWTPKIRRSPVGALRSRTGSRLGKTGAAP
jgi:hypothetical protein